MRAKPLEAHLRDGTYREDRHGHAPVLIGGRPGIAELAEPPDDLDTDAAEHWHRVVPDLIRSGILDRSDLPALMLLCETWSDIRKQRRVLNKQGQFALGSTGQLVGHPAVRMLRDAVAQYNALASAFGLDPLARTRLAVEGLHGLSLASDMADALGTPNLQPVDAVDVIDGVAEDA